MQPLQTLLKSVRSRVSGDKNRFQKGSYDIDLTYITDRIIAMSFPADGVEATYRNSIHDVSAMLKERHGGNVMTLNLSERKYDYSKLQNVQDWCGWPDHHAPPLLLLFRIIKVIYNWLHADPKNVVAVHCLAGKGRTGTVIASFLVYSGLFVSSLDAMNYFAQKRSTNNWGITGPSQKRYIRYFSDIISDKARPIGEPLYLKSIIMHTIPKFALGPMRQGICPIMQIFNVSKTRTLVYSSQTYGSRESDELLSFPCTNSRSLSFRVGRVVKGDLLVIFTHVNTFTRPEMMLRFNLNTGMAQLPRTRLVKSDLDGAEGDKRFAPGFFLDLIFESLEDHPEDAQEVFGFEEYLEMISEESQMFQMRINPHDNGTICFEPPSIPEKIKSARESACAKGVTIGKSGWLTKKGHNFKTWKRRWFVLKDNFLYYYKSPKDIYPAGQIPIEEIYRVDTDPEVSRREEMPNCFVLIVVKQPSGLSSSTVPNTPSNPLLINGSVSPIVNGSNSNFLSGQTNNNSYNNSYSILKEVPYVISAENEYEQEEWVDAIESAMSRVREMGRLFIEVVEAVFTTPSQALTFRKQIPYDLNIYCLVSFGRQNFKTSIEYIENPQLVKGSFQPIWNQAVEFVVFEEPASFCIQILSHPSSSWDHPTNSINTNNNNNNINNNNTINNNNNNNNFKASSPPKDSSPKANNGPGLIGEASIDFDTLHTQILEDGIYEGDDEVLNTLPLEEMGSTQNKVLDKWIPIRRGSSNDSSNSKTVDLLWDILVHVRFKYQSYYDLSPKGFVSEFNSEDKISMGIDEALPILHHMGGSSPNTQTSLPKKNNKSKLAVSANPNQARNAAFTPTPTSSSAPSTSTPSKMFENDTNSTHTNNVKVKGKGTSNPSISSPNSSNKPEIHRSNSALNLSDSSQGAKSSDSKTDTTTTRNRRSISNPQLPVVLNSRPATNLSTDDNAVKKKVWGAAPHPNFASEKFLGRNNKHFQPAGPQIGIAGVLEKTINSDISSILASIRDFGAIDDDDDSTQTQTQTRDISKNDNSKNENMSTTPKFKMGTTENTQNTTTPSSSISNSNNTNINNNNSKISPDKNNLQKNNSNNNNNNNSNSDNNSDVYDDFIFMSK